LNSIHVRQKSKPQAEARYALVVLPVLIGSGRPNVPLRNARHNSHRPQRNGEAFADLLHIAAFALRVGWQWFDLLGGKTNELVFDIGGTSNTRRYRRCDSADPSDKVI
jgi:hypothetical protein